MLVSNELERRALELLNERVVQLASSQAWVTREELEECLRSPEKRINSTVSSLMVIKLAETHGTYLEQYRVRRRLAASVESGAARKLSDPGLALAEADREVLKFWRVEWDSRARSARERRQWSEATRFEHKVAELDPAITRVEKLIDQSALTLDQSTLVESARDDKSDADRVQGLVRWAQSNRWIAATIVAGLLVGGLASFGENSSKLMRGVMDMFTWVRSPHEPTLKGNFVFADSSGLHFFLENKGRKPAFIVSAVLEFEPFKITEILIEASGLEISLDAVGTEMPGFQTSLRRVTAATQIAPGSSQEVVFAIPRGPYSSGDAKLISLGGTCILNISWKGSEGPTRQLTETRPCKALSASFRELVSHG